MALADRLTALADQAGAAADQLRDAAEDAKRAGLTALIDLGAKAQEALDQMPAEGVDEPTDEDAPPEATQLPS